MEKLCDKVLGLWLLLYDRHFPKLIERKKNACLDDFFLLLYLLKIVLLSIMHFIASMLWKWKVSLNVLSQFEMLNFPVHFWDE